LYVYEQLLESSSRIISAMSTTIRVLAYIRWKPVPPLFDDRAVQRTVITHTMFILFTDDGPTSEEGVCEQCGEHSEVVYDRLPG